MRTRQHPILLLLTILVATPCALVQDAFAQANQVSSTLPKLFVIGDSISMQYGPHLEKYVQGVWRYDRKSDDGQAAKNLDVPVGANGGDSRMVLEYLRLKLKDKNFQPDVLLLNCGLHDIKRNSHTNAIQVTAEIYRRNLQTIIQLLQARGIALVWMRTTPVEDERHNSRSKEFKRYARDLDEYNRIADDLMVRHRIPVIDLYAFTKALGSEHFIDHVHYDEAARALQASHIAGYLRAYAQSKPAKK
jgi:lysophospholipase L1-like esterase